jgi:hypothetical protein
VRSLGAVVAIALLAMFHARQDVPLRRPVALQLVRDEHPWHVGQALEQLPEEFLGGVLIPPTLDHYIQDVAVLIHGTPQIVTVSVHGEKDLIEVPLVARLGTPASELIGIRLTELSAPFADGLIRDEDPTCEQELFHIPVAEAEAEVQPDTVADDLSRETVVCVRVGWCGGIHRSSQDSCSAHFSLEEVLSWDEYATPCGACTRGL